jgi:putative hydrolase of the HAD superfamily
MIKAIAFDLDQTLIDFMRMKKVACEAATSAMINAGLKVDEKRLLNEIYAVYNKKGYEYQKVFQDVIKKLTGKANLGVLAYGIVAYRRVKENMLFPYADVKPTLKALKQKYRLAIVSDAPALQPWLRLAAMDLLDYFDVIVTLAEAKKAKPHKRPFQLLLKKLRVKPEEVMFVGDSLSRDIAGANRMGMVSVLAEYGRYGRKKCGIKPRYRIRKFSDLLKIIK